MLKQKFILSYVSQIVIQLLGIVSSIVIARIAGPNVMGKLTFALSYVSVFGFLTQLGFGGAHIKLISEGQPLDRCLGTYVRMVKYTTILFIAVALGFFWIQKYGFRVDFEGFDTEFCIYATILVTAITSIIAIAQTTFAANIQQAKQDIPNIGVNLISSIAKIVIVLLGFRILMLATWNVIHVLLLLGVSLFLMRKQVIGSFDKDLSKRYILISIPFMFAAIANGLIANLDKVLLKFFVSATEVGYYGASYKIGGFIQIIATNIGTMFFPLFSGYIARGEIAELKNKVSQYHRMSLLYIFPTVLFVVIYSPTIVRVLLGSQYAPSVVPMSIITLALYLYTMMIPYGNILVAAGKYYKYMVIQFGILLFYLVILVVMTHPKLVNLKSTGTALALLIMYILSYFVYRQSSKAIADVSLSKDMLKIIAALLVSYGMFFYLFGIVKGKLLAEAGVGILFFVVTYGGLWLLRLIKPEDLTFLKQALSPRQMKSYIVTELIDKE